MNTSPQAGAKGYNDLYFRIAIAFIAAAVIVIFGDRDNIFELLRLGEFYEAMLASFIIALILVTAVNRVTVRLDLTYDWMSHPLQRIGLQVILCFVLPAVAAFALAYLYFNIIGIHILDTVYLRYDFPVILILLFTLNLYYIAFYFYRQGRLNAGGENGQDDPDAGILIATQGGESRVFRYHEIGYFFHAGDFNFVRTTGNEDLLVSGTLDEIEQQLDGRLFFRVNRQMIVHRNTCKSYSHIEHGKLSLVLAPLFKDPVIISQLKAKKFRDWIRG